MNETNTLTGTTPASPQPQLASRRHWLKGLGALLGTGMLVAPGALLARPTAPGSAPLPASALVGGEEYIGIVKILAGTTVPSGWAPCEGQLLAVSQYPGLFAVLGTLYGGDGTQTFALPDLREALGPKTAPVSPDADPAALPAPTPAGPATSFAIKVANAPATTTALGELRLRHQLRPRAQRLA